MTEEPALNIPSLGERLIPLIEEIRKAPDVCKKCNTIPEFERYDIPGFGTTKEKTACRIHGHCKCGRLSKELELDKSDSYDTNLMNIYDMTSKLVSILNQQNYEKD